MNNTKNIKGASEHGKDGMSIDDNSLLGGYPSDDWDSLSDSKFSQHHLDIDAQRVRT